MKRIFIILLLLISTVAYAQYPTGYTGINARYDWLAGKFRTLHAPAANGAPSFAALVYKGAGSLYLDSAANKWYYTQGGEYKLLGQGINTIYTANDSLASNRTVYVSGVSFNTRSLVFSQNHSMNNTTSQPMTITMSTNRFLISRTLQSPGTIPDNFSPFQSVGRLVGSGTVNYSGAVFRYRPIAANFVGGFTNNVATIFNNSDTRGPTTLINTEWQTDRTASQTITGWIGNYRSSLQFTGNTQPLYIDNFVDFIGGQIDYQGIGVLTNRYQFYAKSAKIDSINKSYAFYNEGNLDSNYFAGPVRIPNLPDSDSTAAKPVGRLSNGVLVDLPYWPGGGTGSSPTGTTVSSSTTLSAPVAGGTTVKVDASGGAVTLTFPSAASNSWLIYRIKKTDSSANAINITTLEGNLSTTTQYAGWVVQSDGTNWLTIGVF